MRHRVGRPHLRACYTVPELAFLMGLSRWQLSRMLRRRDIPVDRQERVGRVWLSTFQKLAPEAWESLILRQSMG